MSESKQVYASIVAVMQDLAEVGIEKSQRNQQQGFMFRGIDQLYNTLAPILAKNKLAIVPRVLDREMVERKTRNGGAIYNVTLKVDFDFISAIDGSIHTMTAYGEAMDSTDKATNKALTAAYKYACFTAFCIPTDGQLDGDETTPPETVAQEVKKPEPAATSKPQAKSAAKGVSREEIEDWLTRINEAVAMTDLRNIGAMIYRNRMELSQEDARTLGLNVIAQCCDLGSAKYLDDVEKMAKTFIKEGFVDAKDVEPLLAGLRAKSNA